MSPTSTTTRRAPKPAAQTLANNDNWRDYASCREQDPDLFFPVAHTQGWKTQTKQAKTVCGTCPVRETCLEWALDTGQTTGVWGGMSAGERRRIARPRETQLERCLRMQPWIEKQLAAGVMQKVIAAQLRVDAVLVSRMVRMFAAERAAAAEQEVAAA